MSTPWKHPARTEQQREFLVSAELYVSTAAGASLRKPSQRIKTERRDSIMLSSSLGDEGRKVKEKSSWLALGSRPSGMEHWRPTTCKLSEEGERSLLNIYVDESCLYQTVYIHLLNHTDIRQADSSLFLRKDCIVIHCITGQRWSSTHTAEPVYLHFANSDACNTWLALLRSYAIPEIYGRWFFPDDGGSYRMWRQIELSVIQGRNLGHPRSFLEQKSGGVEPNSEPDAVDMDVSCQILLNDILCGRSTIKKGIGSPDWHENFTFSDLPPFDNLDIVVWGEHKLFKPSILGSVRIPICNFSRGDPVEGWFPVLHGGPNTSDLQIGEIRLKIRVDEEIILPYSSYGVLLQTFNSRNFLDWMSDFETKLRLKTLSSHLMSIAVAKNVLIEQVFELANREVDGTPSSHQTLFRGNTIFTKIVELSMAFYGKPFLEASVGNVLRKLCAEKVSIEIDPVRSGKSPKDVERNVDQLIHWCEEFWKQIYSVRAECPNEMRRLFEHIRKLVEERYHTSDTSLERNRDLPWQSVSAFCFLRFIVPAILHPHLFGLCAGLPSPPIQRSLTLIAKVIQSLANLNATVQKEEFMRGVRDFLRDSRVGMIDYIMVVSTPVNDKVGYPGTVADRHDRLNIVNSLRQREVGMTILDRESIPRLPHLLDIPRHLAIIKAAVIRSSRDYYSKQNSDDVRDKQLDEFCAKCFEVEEQALYRVSQLATRISSDKQRPSALGKTFPSSFVSPVLSPSGLEPYSHNEDRATERRPSRRKRSTTAPSRSDSEESTSRQRTSIDPLAKPRASGDTLSGKKVSSKSNRRLTHSKSSSTDSIPLHGLKDSSTVFTHFTPALDISDDAGKKKKSLLRGILARR